MYYPWSGVLVRLLGAEDFRALRLDRNWDKITAERGAPQDGGGGAADR